MRITIEEIHPARLSEYDRVPQTVEVKSMLMPELVDGGMGGILLREVPVEQPYIKDYDSSGELPSDVTRQFNIKRWGFFLAKAGRELAGAAMVAYDTTGVFMLEGRKDLAVLWDIRVCPQYKGTGIVLFRHAAEWARRRGCSQLKMETQNVNVPACRFYARMGARLGEIRRYGYAAIPGVAHEVMLCWYYDL
jgi:GNAT superfamily N-acetyltransferase